ncbi:MAG TPA: deoxyribose-phosphate aldolase [Anaeromyxobacteraceae bacterium]
MRPAAAAPELAPLIDHTVLRPDAVERDVAAACDEALQYGFAGVCVREAYLVDVVRRLGGAGPFPIAVADFPAGTGTTATRAEEARRLADLGAREIDVVFPLPLLRVRQHAAALLDLVEVVRGAGAARVKVILESGALSGAEKAAACALSIAAGAAFVKTSTGFGAGGATVEDVTLLRELAGAGVGVKASGGIRTTAQALAMVRAGASRLGTSASVAIVAGAP